MVTTLFVAGLGPTARARELGEIFERFGPILRCDIMPPRKTRNNNNNNPYAFVEFAASPDAAVALESLNRTLYEGYLLKIAWAEHPPNHDDHDLAPSHSPSRRATKRLRSRSPLPIRRDPSRVPQTEPDLRHDSTSRYERSDYRARDDDQYSESPNDYKRSWNHHTGPIARDDWNSRHYEPSPNRYLERRDRTWDSQSTPYHERRMKDVSHSGYDHHVGHHDDAGRSSHSRSSQSSRTSRASRFHAPTASSTGKNGTAERKYERCSWDRSSHIIDSSRLVRYPDADEAREFAPNRSEPNGRAPSPIQQQEALTSWTSRSLETSGTSRTSSMSYADRIDYASTPPGPSRLDISDAVDEEDYAKTPPGEPPRVLDDEE
ncbi:hypothetical protein DFH05DRAFT_1498397 [Lentinula detonsa]|uniref:RRM domain-containing protein n=1 Tax=Lentinula detonsa TaxID=2804962 RepID=A0A9W8TWC1_9AGAR|nr:hypothetical protein DFH05DRAFT_1498397 [Lentinula detonsa]